MLLETKSYSMRFKKFHSSPHKFIWECVFHKFHCCLHRRNTCIPLTYLFLIHTFFLIQNYVIVLYNQPSVSKFPFPKTDVFRKRTLDLCLRNGVKQCSNFSYSFETDGQDHYSLLRALNNLFLSCYTVLLDLEIQA
jgi:hypothetical protein